MIPKSNKFPTRVQFLNFRARAAQRATPHLRIMTEERVEKGSVNVYGPRLSVIVPIKVNKRAVVRNNLRRLVYDSAWKSLSGKNIDCIIMFKPIALIKSKQSDDLIVQELRSTISSL